MRGRYFGDRVRNRRCFLRMSLSDLARRVGVKPQTLHSVERNTTVQMLPENLFRLADVLGVNVRELALGRTKAKRKHVNFGAWSIEVESCEVRAGPESQNIGNWLPLELGEFEVHAGAELAGS